ncbi:unnamed protein product [Caenorhabditis brenneri]
MSTKTECFAIPAVHPSGEEKMIHGIVFTNIENPADLKYFLAEVNIHVKIYDLLKGKHDGIYNRAFNSEMGPHAILVVCESDDDFDFVRNHPPFARTTACVLVSMNELL